MKTVLQIKQNFHFVQLQQRVQSEKSEYPHTFDSKLWHAVSYYGSYVPWILRDPYLMNICYMRCEAKFGYSQKFHIQPIEETFFDLDIDNEDTGPEPLPDPWVQSSFDDMNFLGKEDQPHENSGSR